MREVFYYITWLIIIIGFIIYVANYEQYKGALEFIRNIGPSIIFVVGMILIFSRDKGIIRRRRRKGELEEAVYITYYDMLYNDLLAFGTAFVIVAIPGYITRDLNLIDVLQAIVAFLAIFYIRSHYFRKIGR